MYIICVVGGNSNLIHGQRYSSTAHNSGLRLVLSQVTLLDGLDALSKPEIALHRIMFYDQSLRAPTLLITIHEVAGIHTSLEGSEPGAILLYAAVQIIIMAT